MANFYILIHETVANVWWHYSCLPVGRLKIPSDWLDRRLRDLGLDTYVQNFTFKYPVGILKHHVSHKLQNFTFKYPVGILKHHVSHKRQNFTFKYPVGILKVKHHISHLQCKLHQSEDNMLPWLPGYNQLVTHTSASLPTFSLPW